MADNTTLNPGTGGDVIATDDIGGTKHQKVKVEFGGDDSATQVEASAPLPVQIGDGTDQAGVSAAGALQVDGSAVTQPVSAASLPLPAGAATAANQLANGHDVTVDNAGAGAAVNVQDGGNSLTVDAPTGTPVNVQIGDGTDQASVTAAGELSVAIGPSLPAGSANIGDVDVATQPARDRTTDNVGVAIQSDALMNDTTVMTPKFANIDVASSGNNQIVAAIASTTIRVLAVFVAASGAVDVYFNDGTANLLGGTRLVKLDNTGAAGAVGFSLPFNPVGWFETAADNRPINLNLSAAVGAAGCLVYVEV